MVVQQRWPEQSLYTNIYWKLRLFIIDSELSELTSISHCDAGQAFSKETENCIDYAKCS